MESVDYSSHSTTTIFSQDYGQHNHLGWVYNHSHFYLSFKYSSIYLLGNIDIHLISP